MPTLAIIARFCAETLILGILLTLLVLTFSIL